MQFRLPNSTAKLLFFLNIHKCILKITQKSYFYLYMSIFYCTFAIDSDAGRYAFYEKQFTKVLLGLVSDIFINKII